MFAFLGGCAVFYQESEVVDGEGIPTFLISDACTINYKVYTAQSNEAFESGPSIQEYSQWVNEVIYSLGCTGNEVVQSTEDTLSIQITDLSTYRDAGVGYALALTLYLIPMQDLPSPHRRYSIAYGGSSQTIRVTDNGWYGWVFLPVHLYSYWNHEKGIFKERVMEFLTKNET